MIGPKARPIRAVPLRWMAKSTVRMRIAAGRTIWSAAGLMTDRPSMALITEMAGVIIESP